ncbi:MAG: DUF262 domain-containing protein [Lachnospiraceae bacterium]|nr:DUF262 domain-containing protein [Lachnospiraceae bacterium]
MADKSFWSLVEENKVKIPIMQRDYAQGRKSIKVAEIRNKFLKTIFNALKYGKPLTLDFVYGYKNDEIFLPLDGQQRLTTLFLLHWYIAVREGHIEDVKKQLEKFSYETRHSSRVFCKILANYCPDDFLVTDLREYIIDESWFMASWTHDATISSMLTMIQAIHKCYDETEIGGAWESLTTKENGLISFYLLRMDDFKLSDELYIKMNSRGKELTEFEGFKAQYMKELSGEKQQEFNRKIDGEWSDLFWSLYKDGEGDDIAQNVDSAFMRFFAYAKSVIGDDYHERFVRWLDLFADLFRNNQGFFDEHFYFGDDYQEGKVRLFFANDAKDINLFKMCIDNFDASFPISQQLMLYGCILHLEKETVDFKTRIRRLRNLAAQSSDAMRKESLPLLLKATEEVIVSGSLETVKTLEGRHFNSRQISEEIEKEKFSSQNALYPTLCQLEDSILLRGCLAIMVLDDAGKLKGRALAFLRLFEYGRLCDKEYDLISRALVTFGDYSQTQGSRCRLGNYKESVWQELLTPSNERKDYEEKFKPTLTALLDSIDMTEEVSKQLEERVKGYIDECYSKSQYDWDYYYLKYDDFRTGTESGFYIWYCPYVVTKLYKTRLSGYHWDPFLLAVNTILGHKGRVREITGYANDPLNLNGVEIESDDYGFIFSGNELVLNDAVSKGLLTISEEGYFLEITQDQEIDTEDRVEKCAIIIKAIFTDL